MKWISSFRTSIAVLFSVRVAFFISFLYIFSGLAHHLIVINVASLIADLVYHDKITITKPFENLI